MNNKRSAVDKVFAVLNSGKTLTTKQISTRFGVANPRDVIYTLRNEGYNVVTTRTSNKNGTTVKYSLAV